MKMHQIKTLLAVLLMVILTMPQNIYAASVMDDASDMSTHVFKGYNGGNPGSISITKAKLTINGSTKNVYLIALSGTESIENQSTGFWTNLKSGFELNSPYLLKAIEAVQTNVPEGSRLIIAGHSLGGMIAQQMSGNSAIKNHYIVMNVVAFGSPLTNPFGREGTIKRLGDNADIVPYFSAMGTILLPWQISGLNRENGGYGNPINAHLQSYNREDVWGNYDVLGIKNGSATISYNSSDISFYSAPIN